MNLRGKSNIKSLKLALLLCIYKTLFNFSFSVTLFNTEFRETLFREGGFVRGRDANQMWISMANAIRSAGERVVGVSSGRPNGHKEAWWSKGIG